MSSVKVPNQNAYKLTNIFLEMPKMHHPETAKHFKIAFVGKTGSSKVDLIWEVWSMRLRQNARTLILVLGFLHQQLRFLDQTHNILSQDVDINPSFFHGTNTFLCGAFFDFSPQAHIALREVFNVIINQDKKTTL